MSEIPEDALSVDGEDVSIEAAVLAPQLNLTVAELKDAMARGEVRTLVERGEGTDAGRMRLTFRFGSRCWSVMREPDGSIQTTEPPPPDQRHTRPSLMHLLDPGS